ncbi:unnamed protein product [Chironomus riparius]|uniref:Uncharacterized protein n=1 Tax=Chironomus riparius TaxID=315576 RepID=A0A9N9WYP8_9DIPT|nr:unnamed protein product [Chironomus riparius]
MKLFIIISVLIFGALARPQDPAAAQAPPTAPPAQSAQQPGQLNPLGSLGLSTFGGAAQGGNMLGQALGNVGTGLGQTAGIAGGSAIGLGTGIFDRFIPAKLFGF